MIIQISSAEDMINFGKLLGRNVLKGGDVIELIGDIGSGKTTLTKGIVIGLGSKAEVQSPTFTISRRYKCNDNLEVAHYDFYRLHDAGIMRHEIAESINDSNCIVVVEWGDVIKNIMPVDRLTISIATLDANIRQIHLDAHGKFSKRLEAIK